MEQEFFILLAIVATGTGLMVVVAKNPIHSAMSLVACFVQISALFVLLGSPFLAVIQLSVYVGAIMVLFLFVIMMLDMREEARTRFHHKGVVATVIVLLCLAGEIIYLLIHSARLHTIMAPERLLSAQPTRELSLTLFKDFLLPFEIASIILLVALIGAVVLARTDVKRDHKQHKTEGLAQ